MKKMVEKTLADTGPHEMTKLYNDYFRFMLRQESPNITKHRAYRVTLQTVMKYPLFSVPTTSDETVEF